MRGNSNRFQLSTTSRPRSIDFDKDTKEQINNSQNEIRFKIIALTAHQIHDSNTPAQRQLRLARQAGKSIRPSRTVPNDDSRKAKVNDWLNECPRSCAFLTRPSDMHEQC